MGKLAVLAGKGALPVALSDARPDALLFTLAGMSHDLSRPTFEHRFEKLGGLIQDMKDRGATEVVMAGGMPRPQIDISALDAFMMANAARLQAAFQQGDDTLLRLFISLFEEQGIKVRGAHEILPELTIGQGAVVGPSPTADQMRDIEKAADLLKALSPHDLGQGAVVSAGLCLGIETLQGTDALLQFVAETPKHLVRQPGVFVKVPKSGQDLRVDMPAIGPGTIEKVIAAGLAGIALAAHRVILLERAKTIAAAEKAGLFLYGLEGL
ncbi:UDP-2,3-diacylglucosamine diphosphatase LpxI [Cognatishimia sp. WU-CL00825]|uniref:LpxI family protein n=1 Tax=Cognatishimia sp. WU-CL00825 TaxID=3127658 RepID=UPI00310231C0